MDCKHGHNAPPLPVGPSLFWAAAAPAEIGGSISPPLECRLDLWPTKCAGSDTGLIRTLHLQKLCTPPLDSLGTLLRPPCEQDRANLLVDERLVAQSTHYCPISPTANLQSRASLRRQEGVQGNLPPSEPSPNCKKRLLLKPLGFGCSVTKQEITNVERLIQMDRDKILNCYKHKKREDKHTPRWFDQLL